MERLRVDSLALIGDSYLTELDEWRCEERAVLQPDELEDPHEAVGNAFGPRCLPASSPRHALAYADVTEALFALPSLGISFFNSRYTRELVQHLLVVLRTLAPLEAVKELHAVRCNEFLRCLAACEPSQLLWLTTVRWREALCKKS